MKTLAVYHKQLGDTLLLQPALARLASQDGEDVGLITRPGFEPVVELMPGVCPVTWRSAPRVERLYSYDAGDRSTMASAWAAARKKHLLTFSDFYLRFFHPWVFHDISFRDQMQDYRGRYLWSFTPGNSGGVFEPPRLHPPPPAWAHKAVPEEAFLVIHPTSAWKRKCWAASRWIEVIAKIQQSSGLRIVLSGGGSEWERAMCDEIAGSCRDLVNLGGQTSLREIIAIMSKSSMVLTVDGFVSHLAQAYRKPCVTLFGATNANHWHIETDHSKAVFEGSDPRSKTKTMEGIPVERVWSVAEPMLRAVT